MPLNPIFKQNAIYIPSKNEYIVSSHDHDYKQYTHTDGRFIAIDGGPSYVRRLGHFDLYTEGVFEEWCVNSTSDKFITVAQKALWGTKGKDGKQPLKFKPIRSFTRAHLRAIKKNCAGYMNPILLKVVKYWLKQKYNE